MNKIFLLILAFLALSGCYSGVDRISSLQQRIDSLEMASKEAYKPGFGEFMGNIQAHHIKLWYAGENSNWKLAQFELDEIKETVDDIQNYEKERQESKVIDMIRRPLDSLAFSIAKKDLTGFTRDFHLLTNTCNACHRAVHFEFNVVKIPDSQPFSNQDFSPSR